MKSFSEIEWLRREYMLQSLNREDLKENPFDQFSAWFDEAVSAGLYEPNAMVLATAGKNGMPSSRTVLLKQIDEEGFLFFTNYESRKGKDLAENPYASMTFLWHELERQINIHGAVEKTSREISAAYLTKRPRASRLAALASRQSCVIESRDILLEERKKLEKEYEGKEVPLPPYWGGYRVIPFYFEFWQGRENRLHDRFRYCLQEDRLWKIDRLAP